jgi:SNF2 family DNA or RNA helicase
MTTMIPFPTQLSGAKFLASNTHALLADEPRCGKTGTAVMAADYVMAQTILVITTASGRGVWERGFEAWAALERSMQIALPGKALDKDVVIVGWPSLTNPKIVSQLVARQWDLIISDEDHFAKNYDAKRTQALYGRLIDDGEQLNDVLALFAKAKRVWPLTGTPLPHSPADMYPRLRALAPHRLAADPAKGWPDVTRYNVFLHRYCQVRMKKLSHFNSIPVIMGGKNEAELAERIKGFYLRRTQKDVGIREPIYDLLPLLPTKGERDAAILAERDLDRRKVLNAAATGDTKALEMHLGTLRRLTGDAKAHEVVKAVIDEFDCGLDKIVLAYWHKSVAEILADGLAKYGVTGIDGSTPALQRQPNVEAFWKPDGPRVFLAQIEAAGEAIDLSNAAVLWFVESTFSPRSMKQMSLRITNHTQQRQAVVKVCTLTGSIDEALQASLMRLWTAIREIMK